ncbi:unnamed protein product [Durusdinium trenchii]|uniref:Spindle and kinetochore-associated protein 3 n=1 Tax=Durusdinium trenchii TaxID=1381693 RepID=A0ABP0KLG1_9DINO
MASTASMEAAFRYLAEEIRQEMRTEMMKVVERAASSCASICMDRMQALRAELLSEFEEVAQNKGTSNEAAQEVRRRTSFYELYSDDVRMGSDQEDDGEDLAKLYEHLEKCARRRSSAQLGSGGLAQGLLNLPGQATDIKSNTSETSDAEEQKALPRHRRWSDSAEEELVALDDFLKASPHAPSPRPKEAVRDLEDRVAFLEFFLYPAAAPKTKSALTVAQRVDLIDGHLWGNESQLFEVLELSQRVRLAEQALLGLPRARNVLDGAGYKARAI